MVPLWLIVNGILYVVFILLIILYELFVDDTEVKCGGRIVEESVRTAQIISIMYRSFVCAVAVIFGLSFSIYGMKLIFFLKERVSNKMQRLERKYLSLWHIFFQDKLVDRDRSSVVNNSINLFSGSCDFG